MTRGRTAIELCNLAHQHALLRRPQRTVVERTVHDPEMRPDRISSDIPALPIRTLPAIQVHNDWTLHNIIVAADGVDYIVDFNSMRARTCAGSTGWRARQGRRGVKKVTGGQSYQSPAIGPSPPSCRRVHPYS
jgi:hypothetical protein